MIGSVMVEDESGSDFVPGGDLQGLSALSDVTNLIVPAAVGAAVYAFAPRFKKSMKSRERVLGAIGAALVVLLLRK